MKSTIFPQLFRRSQGLLLIMTGFVILSKQILINSAGSGTAALPARNQVRGIKHGTR